MAASKPDWGPAMRVPGVRLAAVSAGISRAGEADLTLMEIAEGASAAALFTRNAFRAAPVQVAEAHLRSAPPRYLLINTGSANAGTGEQGLDAARACCAALAELTGARAEQALPFSTGVIGEHLPAERIAAALPAALAALAEDNWPAAANAILTTDTRPKLAARSLELGGRPVSIVGMAKGAGMLRPDLATMLAFIATDAAIAPPLLNVLWRGIVERTFNRVTVDGDTSTNDAAVLIATGRAGNPPLREGRGEEGKGDGKLTRKGEEDGANGPQSEDGARNKPVEVFSAALESLALELAQGLVRDGEGATKFVEVAVSGGRDEAECLAAAYSIAHSPLVKTALFASDPNWGRMLAALGRAGIEDFDVSEVSLRINDVLVAEQGCRAARYAEADGKAALRAEDIRIDARLNRGPAAAAVWTSDFSCDYVKINAEYRT